MGVGARLGCFGAACLAGWIGPGEPKRRGAFDNCRIIRPVGLLERPYHVLFGAGQTAHCLSAISAYFDDLLLGLCTRSEDFFGLFVQVGRDCRHGCIPPAI